MSKKKQPNDEDNKQSPESLFNLGYSDPLDHCFNEQINRFVISMVVDMPNFGLFTGDYLTLKKREPRHREFVACSTAGDNDGVALGYFQRWNGTSIVIECWDGKPHSFEPRTVLVLKSVTFSLRHSKTRKDRHPVELRVNR